MDREEELDDSFDEDFFYGCQIWRNFVLEWDRRRRMAAHMVCLVAAYLVKQSEYRNYVDRSMMPNNLERECVRQELTNELKTNEKCHDIIRMGPEDSYDMHEESRPTTPHESVSNKSVASSQSKKRKASSSIDYSGIENSMKEIAFTIKEGNEILREGNEILRERNEILRSRICETNEILQRTRARVYSEEDVFDELVRLGIDSELLDRAYSFLIEKPERIRAFFGNPANRRVRYLMTMLNSAGEP